MKIVNERERYPVRISLFHAFVLSSLALNIVTTCAVTGTNTEANEPHRAHIILYQSDFDSGTYRIRSPGKYKLGEDISFAPQPQNDYWPTFEQWDYYPPSRYYLGFFAAITIESDDVTIDLNGKTLQQGKDHYLLQRFFNAIELNDKIFVPNEGVGSLNYQRSDEFANAGKVGSMIVPKNVRIQNGVIGRSSHAGIHGNGIDGLQVVDVTIRDFEVAGIHCNGCRNAVIRRVHVGPASTSVPVLATFSNARFLDFYADRLIPFGFAQEPGSDDLFKLFEGTITFGDRPNKVLKLSDVFDKLHQAVALYRDWVLGKIDNKANLSSDEKTLLHQARNVFDNRFGTTDGSVQYGIFFNRLGLPTQDDPFVGAGREVSDITIVDVIIEGLDANPVEVPSLATEDGTHMQGPARDLIRILDITNDRLRTVIDSRYEGNLLSDAYFAMWQLSNGFYRLRVFDSDCGNYGSNASFPMNLQGFPSDLQPTCADLGRSIDPTLTGRDVTMLQKRYFGGLQLSQGLYDWATTPYAGLGPLLSTPDRQDVARAGGRHSIICDHDTMFHPNHGVVGLKIVEAARVKLDDVTIKDLRNTADVQIWLCKNKWQVQPSTEDILPMTAALNGQQGAAIRGLEMVRCDDVLVRKMDIVNLTSIEGTSIGIDVVGDRNERTDYEDNNGITYKLVNIDKLSSGFDVGTTIPVKSVATPYAVPRGVSVGPPEESGPAWNNPRVIFNYQMTNARTPRLPGEAFPSLTYTDPSVVVDMKLTTSLDTDDKIISHRRRVLAFYEEHYGMRFESNVHEYGLIDPIPVLHRNGTMSDSVVQLGKLIHNTRYHGTSLCVTDGEGLTGRCSDTTTSLVHDFAWNFIPGPSGYTLHGAYGRDHGKFCHNSNVIWVGLYSFERVSLPGVQDGNNFEVYYFGTCPTLQQKIGGGAISFYINCPLESTQFGRVMGTGGYVFRPSEDGTEWILDGYPSMVFDDQVLNPVPGTRKETFFFDEDIPYIQTNDWRFSFLADGLFPTRITADDAISLGRPHHYIHEAGIQYLQRRTSLKTDEQIMGLRRGFLTHLRDFFGINIDPNAYDDVPLDGIIDLGGTNHIVPYVVNEDARMRIMTKRGHNDAKVDLMPTASRLHEGGFRLIVGRSGVVTRDGRVPFGSLFNMGIMIIDDTSSPSGHYEVNFKCGGYSILNEWSTNVVYHLLESEELGEGRYYATSPEPEHEAGGVRILMRGVLVFGNIDGRVPPDEELKGGR